MEKVPLNSMTFPELKTLKQGGTTPNTMEKLDETDERSDIGH